MLGFESRSEHFLLPVRNAGVLRKPIRARWALKDGYQIRQTANKADCLSVYLEATRAIYENIFS